MAETAVAKREADAVVVQSIIMPPGNLSDYMQRLIETSDAGIEEARRKLLKAENTDNSDAIEEAERGVRAAQQVPGQIGHDQQRHWRQELNQLTRGKKVRIARSKVQLKRAEAMSAALRDGYVPLPRLPAVSMKYMYEVIPPEVLGAITEASEAGVFEEFRVIDGREANRYGTPTGRHAADKRDPIIVGLIGNEMFAIGWWRPRQ